MWACDPSRPATAGSSSDAAPRRRSFWTRCAANASSPSSARAAAASRRWCGPDVFLGLPEAMNRGRYLVPRLGRRELREAIEGPARLRGAEVAPRLVDRLLNELGDRLDRLPVLQHVLLRTWERWAEGEGGPVDLVHYEAVGTLRDALAEHAEEALAAVDRDLTAKVFQRLADTDHHGRRVRRAASFGDLVEVCDAEAEDIEAVRCHPLRKSWIFGVRGLTHFVRETLTGPWLVPEQVRSRLAQSVQLRLT